MDLLFRKRHQSEDASTTMEALQPQDYVSNPDEVLTRLNPGFFKDDFDPIRHLVEALPEEQQAVFDMFMQEQMEKDVAKDAILAQISRTVFSNYSQFINGMKQIYEIDLDITRAAIHVQNALRNLRESRETLVNASMSIIAQRRQRERVAQSKRLAKSIKELVEGERAIYDKIRLGKLSEAVQMTIVGIQLLKQPDLRRLKVLQAFTDKYDRAFPAAQAALQERIGQMCEEFDTALYTDMVRAYLLLDKYQAEATLDVVGSGAGEQTRLVLEIPTQVVNGVTAAMDRQCKEALVSVLGMDARDAATPMRVKAELLGQGIEDIPIHYVQLSLLERQVKPEHFLACVTRILASLCDLLHGCFLIMQWHRNPFDPRNDDLEFLHRFIQGPPEDVGPAQWRDPDTSIMSAAEVLKGGGTTLDAGQREALNTASRRLRLDRVRIWHEMQKRVAGFVTEVSANMEAGLPLHSVVKCCVSCQRFMTIGEEFCEDNSHMLRGALRKFINNYFTSVHKDNLNTLSVILRDKERWQRIPLQESQLQAVLTVSAAKFGAVTKAQADEATAAALGTGLPTNPEPQLPKFVRSGNPFASNASGDMESMSVASDESESSEEVVVEDEDDEASDNEPDTGALPSAVDYGTSYIVTTSAYHGVAMAAARYVAVLESVPVASDLMFECFCKLYDMYMLNATSAMLTDEAGEALVSPRVVDLDPTAFEFKAITPVLLAAMLMPESGSITPKEYEPMNDPYHGLKATIERGKILNHTEQRSIDVHTIDHTKSSSLFGLHEQSIALGSLSFCVKVLQALRPRIQEHCNQAQLNAVEAWYRRTQTSTLQLQAYAINALVPILFPAARTLPDLMLMLRWDNTKECTAPSEYTSRIIEPLLMLAARLNALLQSGGISPELAKLTWGCVLTHVLERFAEGVSRIKKCSPTGRAQLSMDLNAICQQSKKTYLVLPEYQHCPYSQAAVGSYIQAFYLDDPDQVMQWILNNKNLYALRHVRALYMAGTGPKWNRARAKNDLQTIEDLYNTRTGK